MDATNRHVPVEDELIKVVALGDSEAFGRLYHLYETRVYHFVLALVHDPKLAEEVVVEAMAGVWRGAARYAGRSRLSTWIFGIARHKAMDALRDRSRRDQRTVSLDEVVNLAHFGVGPVESMELKNMEALMHQAFAKLSSEHQEILRLTFYEELPYQDIAMLLNIPVNTVKTRVFYAKKQLKQQLQRVLHPEPLS